MLSKISKELIKGARFNQVISNIYMGMWNLNAVLLNFRSPHVQTEVSLSRQRTMIS